MKKICLLLLAAVAMGLAPHWPGFCEEPRMAADQPAPPKGRDSAWKPEGDTEKFDPPVIRKLSDGVFQVGEVTVNKPEEYVSVKGAVNMAEGLVEYLACGAMGKLHESVLVLEVQPYHLQVALLLLGLEPGENAFDRQGAPGTPKGDPVEIWVSWKPAGQTAVKKRAEALVLNVKTDKPMAKTHWIYTGSMIIDNRFMAQIEHSIVATYHDPFAMFDHPLKTGTDDTIYYANKKTLPPKGTPVTLMIRPIDLPADGAEE